MIHETLRFDTKDRIATITLNRPERMNAWNATMAAELSRAMSACDADDDIRVVVITGAGKAFCAGADLGRGGETFAGRGEGTLVGDDPDAEVFPYMIRKPVIAAITGHAVGVGITYPMLCDVRYVAEDAKIQFAFVRRGVIPELSSHVTVQRAAGFSVAADLLLSGRMIRGREAAALGLASKALPAAEVLPAALELARDIAVNTAPVSVAISKRLLWDGMTTSVSGMRHREHGLFAWAGGQADAREGIASFLEKRAPEWSMRPSRDLPADPPA